MLDTQPLPFPHLSDALGLLFFSLSFLPKRLQEMSVRRDIRNPPPLRNIFSLDEKEEGGFGASAKRIKVQRRNEPYN